MRLSEYSHWTAPKCSPCTSKKRALEMISEIVAMRTGQNPTELFECMLSREKVGSTGIGNGIAILMLVCTQQTKPLRFYYNVNLLLNLIQ